ncbi:MAG TPA: inositol monophosphatase family protein [Actinomycetospora sp.]|nr:inositol monophosphatase family protein [Actinomycetospora sp.]
MTVAAERTTWADTAERAARAGGAVLLEHRGRVHDVRLKDARVDVTSSADLAAQDAVTAAIHAEHPDHVVIGEESSGSAADAGGELRWWVDPLDGTRNYLHGVPFFAVAVSATVAGEAVAAAVYDPLRDELYRAVRGGGATCNGHPLQVASTARAAEALVVVQAQSADPAVIAEFSRLMRAMLTVSAGVRFPGAPALVLAHVAAGHYTAYVERDMDPWDVAGGRLLVEEAGGRVTDFAGCARDASTRHDLVASNGLVHDELVAATGMTFEEGG